MKSVGRNIRLRKLDAVRGASDGSRLSCTSSTAHGANRASNKEMRQFHKSCKWVVGIDEAGRGPIAGPVSVGAVVAPVEIYHKIFLGAHDSKKMTERAREEYYEKLLELQKDKKINFTQVFAGEKIIDKKGIVFAIFSSLEKCLIKLNVNPKNTMILMDGALRAPSRFLHQQTIIKGDDKVRIISSASIVAKVLRDRKMIRLRKKYPNYDFEIHKGYGTAMHYKNIKKFGLSDLHRKSFLKKFI